MKNGTEELIKKCRHNTNTKQTEKQHIENTSDKKNIIILVGVMIMIAFMRSFSIGTEIETPTLYFILILAFCAICFLLKPTTIKGF